MTNPKGPTGCETDGAQRKPVPALPAWKAFVVQFSREANTQTGIVAGRVEHLSSGRRARSSSTEELLAVLCKLLDAVGTASDTEGSDE